MGAEPVENHSSTFPLFYCYYFFFFIPSWLSVRFSVCWPTSFWFDYCFVLFCFFNFSFSDTLKHGAAFYFTLVTSQLFSEISGIYWRRFSWVLFPFFLPVADLFRIISGRFFRMKACRSSTSNHARIFSAANQRFNSAWQYLLFYFIVVGYELVQSNLPISSQGNINECLRRATITTEGQERPSSGGIVEPAEPIIKSIMKYKLLWYPLSTTGDGDHGWWHNDPDGSANTTKKIRRRSQRRQRRQWRSASSAPACFSRAQTPNLMIRWIPFS